MDDVLAARRTNLWRQKVKVMVGPFGLRGGRDHFYRNKGDGTFEDATDQAGMTDTAESYGLGMLASDLDNDGDVDVFVANDSNPNFRYRNEGKGKLKFTEIGTWSGAGLNSQGIAQAGMGIDAADIDGDGLQDIALSTFIHQIEPAGSLWASAHEVRRGGNPARGVAPKGLQPVQLCRRNGVSQRVMIIVNNSGNWLEAPVRLGCWNRLWSGRTTAWEGTGPL